MKIAYIIYSEAVVLGAGNGIRAQALKWAELLRSGGHEVVLIDHWATYDWSKFDVIHVFRGFSDLAWYADLAARNPRIVFSPIWDGNMPIGKLKLYRCLDFTGYHHPLALYARNLRIFKKVFVRSSYEASVMTDGLGMEAERIAHVPLSYEFPESVYSSGEREPFCLHISTLSQPRKNVLRLIAAAKKYGFRLVLAGKHGTEEEFRPIQEAIRGADNIEVKGFLSDEEMMDLYRRAKVFALPSVEEGVGLVALNAAVAGCEVVITSVGGPKDYFGKFARQVDPYDVDSIGLAIRSAMQELAFQPQLRTHVMNEYSPTAVAEKIIQAYGAV